MSRKVAVKEMCPEKKNSQIDQSSFKGGVRKREVSVKERCPEFRGVRKRKVSVKERCP